MQSTPEELAAQVVKMIQSYKGLAKAAHDDLVLPKPNGQPVSLELLFDDPEALMGAMIRGGWVVPFHPDRSMFLVSIVGTAPNRGPMQGRLAAEDIELLKAWIAAGAVLPPRPGA